MAKQIYIKKSDKEKIYKFLRLLKKQGIEASEVILFGSYARGDAGLDSDVDLLVVMPVKGSRRKAAVDIGVALHDVPVSKDIVVTTPDDFEWRKEVTGTVEYPAVHEGRVLYAAS